MATRGRRTDPLNKRAEALAVGLPTFSTGMLCVKGHDSLRYTATLLCVECKRLTFKKAYEKNKDRLLSYAASWRDKNRNHVNMYAAKYRVENPEKYKEIHENYRLNNKHKRCSIQSLRNAKKKQSCPAWLSNEQLKQIESIYLKAKELSKVSGLKMAVDHMVPIGGKNVCGLHVPWNLQIIDSQTNSKKHAALTEAAYRPKNIGIMLSGKALPWYWSNHANNLGN